MVLWWIGAVILLVVVLPVVIFLLNRVLAALERIRGATDNVLTACPRRWRSPTRRSRKSRRGRSGTPAR
jgi:hypothetical protein